MAKNSISFEEGAKLNGLDEAYVDAMSRALNAIAHVGMPSEAYRKAEAEASTIARQRKEIPGLTGRHWMMS
jgi:hypothetical protein